MNRRTFFGTAAALASIPAVGVPLIQPNPVAQAAWKRHMLESRLSSTISLRKRWIDNQRRGLVHPSVANHFSRRMAELCDEIKSLEAQ